MGRRMLCPVSGKRIFFSNREARQEINFFARKNMRYSAYRCVHCHYIHLTTKHKKRGKDHVDV